MHVEDVARFLVTGGRPVALPAFVHQRLWAHILDRMHWRGRARSPVRRGEKKYWMPAQRACPSPLPVHTAFVLETDPCRAPIGVTPLTSAAAFRALWRHTHRKRAVHALGQRPAHFRTTTAMA